MRVHAFIRRYVACRPKETAADREDGLGGGGYGVYRMRILDEISSNESTPWPNYDTAL